MSSTRDKLIEQIASTMNAGNLPWRQPWNMEKGLPCNFVSRRRYRGINPLLLKMAARAHNFDSKFWGTRNQWRKAGYEIKTRRRGTPIILFLPFQKNGIKRFCLKTYYLLSANEVMDWIEPDIVRSFRVEELLRQCDVNIDSFANRAAYDQRMNTIYLPPMTCFDTPEDYYETALHELVHFSRVQLGEKDLGRATEELIAEIGACYLASELGITLKPELLENSKAYLHEWLKLTDSRTLFVAAKHATASLDYLLGSSTPSLKEVG